MWADSMKCVYICPRKATGILKSIGITTRSRLDLVQGHLLKSINFWFLMKICFFCEIKDFGENMVFGGKMVFGEHSFCENMFFLL